MYNYSFNQNHHNFYVLSLFIRVKNNIVTYGQWVEGLNPLNGCASYEAKLLSKCATVRVVAVFRPRRFLKRYRAALPSRRKTSLKVEDRKILVAASRQWHGQSKWLDSLAFSVPISRLFVAYRRMCVHKITINSAIVHTVIIVLPFFVGFSVLEAFGFSRCVRYYVIFTDNRPRAHYRTSVVTHYDATRKKQTHARWKRHLPHSDGGSRPSEARSLSVFSATTRSTVGIFSVVRPLFVLTQ